VGYALAGCIYRDSKEGYMRRDTGIEDGAHIRHILPEAKLAPDDVARMDRLTEALKATPAEIRTLITRLRSQEGIYQDDGEVANAGDTSLTVTPSSNNNILVKTIVFQGPTGCTALTLKLGQRLFTWTNPIQGGYWPNMEWVLRPDEVRTLTWAPAAAGGGDVFLWIMGVQLPQVTF
jgi:hypothetical protein